MGPTEREPIDLEIEEPVSQEEAVEGFNNLVRDEGIDGTVDTEQITVRNKSIRLDEIDQLKGVKLFYANSGRLMIFLALGVVGEGFLFRWLGLTGIGNAFIYAGSGFVILAVADLIFDFSSYNRYRLEVHTSPPSKKRVRVYENGASLRFDFRKREELRRAYQYLESLRKNSVEE